MTKQSLAEPKGFTLIEITMVLVLLGILAAVAVPKFFDLQEEAEQKAVLASAAEVQARLDATFGTKVLEGLSCADARTYAAEIAHLADDGEKSFGEFAFKIEGDIRDGALSLKYSRGDEEWKDVAGFSLLMPKCSGDELLAFASGFKSAFNSFVSNTYGSGYPREDEDFTYDIWVSSNNVSLRASSKADEWVVQVQKNVNVPYVETVKVGRREGSTVKMSKDLQRGLQSGETVAQRNQYVDIFVSHCPNFDTLFRIETHFSNDEEYKVIRPKQVSSL